jgi:hypothetical protein
MGIIGLFVGWVVGTGNHRFEYWRSRQSRRAKFKWTPLSRHSVIAPPRGGAGGVTSNIDGIVQQIERHG